MNLNLFDLLQTHNYHVNAAATLRALLEANGIMTEEFPGMVLTPDVLFAAPHQKWNEVADYLENVQSAYETLCSTPPSARADTPAERSTLAEIFRDDPAEPDVVLDVTTYNDDPRQPRTVVSTHTHRDEPKEPWEPDEEA